MPSPKKDIRSNAPVPVVFLLICRLEQVALGVKSKICQLAKVLSIEDRGGC